MTRWYGRAAVVALAWLMAAGPGCSSKSGGQVAAPAADGAKTFAMACARCHGPAGRGDGPQAATVGPVPTLHRTMPAEYVREVVTRGRGTMPAHVDRLSAGDIEAVVQHVMSLAK